MKEQIIEVDYDKDLVEKYKKEYIMEQAISELVFLSDSYRVS